MGGVWAAYVVLVSSRSFCCAVHGYSHVVHGWSHGFCHAVPRTRCVECNFVHFKDHFGQAQWNRKDEFFFCKACVNNKEEQGTPYRCNTCGLWKATDAFPECYRQFQSLTTRVCENCIERRQCCVCGKQKPATDFKAGEWSQASRQNDSRGKCKTCALRGKGTKKMYWRMWRNLAH